MVNKKENSLILNDLLSLPQHDIETLYAFYNVNNINDLIVKIYGTTFTKKGNLPSIFDAIRDGDITAMNEIIASPGFDINAQNSNGYTALMMSIELSWRAEGSILLGQKDIAKQLIELKSNLDLRTNIRQETALMIAIDNRNTEIAKLLVEKGANLNLQNKSGNTPVMLAVRENMIDVFDLMLKKEPNLNLKDEDDNTALTLIDRSNDNSLLLYIIDKNIPIPDEITNRMKNYYRLKIHDLKIQIGMLKTLMNDEQTELLGTNKACSSEDIKDLENCLQIAQDIIKYEPGGKKMKKLEKKYENHPYFS